MLACEDEFLRDPHLRSLSCMQCVLTRIYKTNTWGMGNVCEKIHLLVIYIYINENTLQL